MGELLRMVVEYQTLTTRRDKLRETLSPAEERRLGALDRLLSAPVRNVLPGVAVDDAPLPDKRRHPRIEVNMPARLHKGDKTWDVTVTELGAGGLGLGPDAPDLPPGEMTILHLREPEVECRLLCRVRWLRGQAACQDLPLESHGSSIGLAFAGVPQLVRAPSSPPPMP